MLDAAEMALLESVPDGLFIGGEWRQASSGSTLKVYDPATGEAIKTIADAGVEDGSAALDAAAESAADWAKTPPRERAEILRRAFDLTMQDKEFLAEVEKLRLDVEPVQAAELPGGAPPGIVLRLVPLSPGMPYGTEQSGTSLHRRYVDPLDPPVPVFIPMIRSTVLRCRNRHSWKLSSRSTCSSQVS